MIKITENSLNLLRSIAEIVPTFHHHQHILFDIANHYPKDYLINYVEIGCYAGTSACLMLQRPNTQVTSIDLGFPLNKQSVLYNINKWNHHKNRYDFIQGNSKDQHIKEHLLDIVTKIDILFIDGDHCAKAVQSDFSMYKELIADKGFIVFDDYNDVINCPEVKVAVDFIMEYASDFKKIGSFKNVFEAYPKELKEGNCFVIRKK